MAVTTRYGRWLNHANELTIVHTIQAALGEYADDYDLDAIKDGYITAINAALPDGVFLTGDEFHGPYHDEDANFDGYDLDEDGRLDIKTIVADVDLYAIVEQHELLTIDRVVDELGFKGDSAKGTARKTLSRWGVERYDMVDHPESGRPQARYKAAEVRAAKASAPRPRTTTARTTTATPDTAALIAAARFVLTWADDMHHAATFADRHMLCEHPSANVDAQRHTQEETEKFRNELESLVDALEPHADRVGAPRT